MKTTEEYEKEIEELEAERDKWQARFVEITQRITPKGVNVPRIEVRRRRVKNKAARKARRALRRHR